MKPEILITDRFDLAAEVELRRCQGYEVRKANAPHLKNEDLSRVEILVTRSKTEVDKNLLARAPQLRMVVTATSGFDHLDLELLKSKNIAAAHTPEANAQSAAELTWALVLACARQIPVAHNAILAGEWNKNLDLGVELCGKVYGIVGFGRIGKRVARIAQSFGMKVVAADPYVDNEVFAEFGVQRMGQEEVVRMAEVVSVHVPLTKRTRRMFNEGLFDAFHEHALFINTSRGEVVDETALVHALRDGKLDRAGLDVFEREPLDRESAICRSAKVVLSSHIGARTHEAFAKASRDAAEEVKRFIANSPLSWPLPPTSPWYSEVF